VEFARGRNLPLTLDAGDGSRSPRSAGGAPAGQPVDHDVDERVEVAPVGGGRGRDGFQAAGGGDHQLGGRVRGEAGGLQVQLSGGSGFGEDVADQSLVAAGCVADLVR
jgi:hypothetical protein